MKKRWFIILFLLTVVCGYNKAIAQGNDMQLAAQYLATGEAEKALDIYQKLYKTDNDTYFPYYVKCLISLKKFDDAEAVTKKMLRKDPDNRGYVITLGAIYTQNGNADKAKQLY